MAEDGIGTPEVAYGIPFALMAEDGIEEQRMVVESRTSSCCICRW